MTTKEEANIINKKYQSLLGGDDYRDDIKNIVDTYFYKKSLKYSDMIISNIPPDMINQIMNEEIEGKILKRNVLFFNDVYSIITLVDNGEWKFITKNFIRKYGNLDCVPLALFKYKDGIIDLGIVGL